MVLGRAYNGSNSPAHVYEYADRLEFDNTGNLYGKARPENFPTETDYRNPLISSVMRALGYVNRFGMGIGLVADELKANGNPPAEYVFSEPSSFKVIVRSQIRSRIRLEQIQTPPRPIGNKLEQILEQIRTNPWNKSSLRLYLPIDPYPRPLWHMNWVSAGQVYTVCSTRYSTK